MTAFEVFWLVLSVGLGFYFVRFFLSTILSLVGLFLLHLADDGSSKTAEAKLTAYGALIISIPVIDVHFLGCS